MVKKIKIDVEPPTVEQLALIQKILDEVRNHPEKYPVFSELPDHAIMCRIHALHELGGVFYYVLDPAQLKEMEKILVAVGDIKPGMLNV